MNEFENMTEEELREELLRIRQSRRGVGIKRKAKPKTRTRVKKERVKVEKNLDDVEWL